MRIRQIGTLIFNADTNIVVDAMNQDVPGIGFRANDLFDPQPFAVEIAFRRATRQDALNAVSTLARELHSYSQRRQNEHLAVAGGVLVVAEDEAGGGTPRAYLRDSSVTLLGIEATATGVLARVRVTGTLNHPFLYYIETANTLSSLLPYERRVATLSNLSDAYLYKQDISFSASNAAGLYNVLLALEELESATGTSRIIAINPTNATNGITLNSWDAGWETLTRATFSSATSGTITYTIGTTFPADVYRLFVEIFCPTTPSVNARYLIHWGDQPQIAETIVGDRSWYTPTLLTRGDAVFTLSLQIQNVPTGTLVMPIILIPTDGVSVWNALTPPPLGAVRIRSHQSAMARPFVTFPGNGTIYGPPGAITSRYVAVFNGMMVPTITNATANMSINSRRIEPAAFA